MKNFLVAYLFISFLSGQLVAQPLFTKLYISDVRNLSVNLIVPAEHKGCILAGTADDDGLVMSVDSSGNITWNRVFSGLTFTALEAAGPDIALAGMSGTATPFLMLLSGQGAVKWTKTLAYNGYQSARPVSVSYSAPDSSFYVCGNLSLRISTASPRLKGFVTRVGSQGTVAWSRDYAVSDSTVFITARTLPDSGMVLIGNSGLRRAFLLSLSDSGGVNWCRRYYDPVLPVSAEDLAVHQQSLVAVFRMNSVLVAGTDMQGVIAGIRTFNMGGTARVSRTSEGGLLLWPYEFFGAVLTKGGPFAYPEWSVALQMYFGLVAPGESKSSFVTGNGPIHGARSFPFKPHIVLYKLDSMGNNGGCLGRVTNPQWWSVSLETQTLLPAVAVNGSVQSLSQTTFSIQISAFGDCVGIIGDITEAPQSGFLAYPNPASARMQIKWKLAPMSSVDYAISDLCGRVVCRSSSAGKEHEIDIAALSPAVYILEMSGGDGMKKRVKVVVDR